MNDQAEELRKLMKLAARESRNSPPIVNTSSGRNNDILMSVQAGQTRPTFSSPRLMVIAGGKGGVGATTLSVLAAESLARRKQRVILVDGDLERGDIATITGILPHASIGDVLLEKTSIEDALQPGPQGTLLLPAQWPGDRIPNYANSAFRTLVDELKRLGHLTDWIILDVGRGLALPAWESLWDCADMVSIVTTGDAVAVVDAYAVIKQRMRHRSSAHQPAHLEVLVNQVCNVQQAEEIQSRLALSCQRFLNIGISAGGWVPLAPGRPTSGDGDLLARLRGPCQSSILEWTTRWQQNAW